MLNLLIVSIHTPLKMNLQVKSSKSIKTGDNLVILTHESTLKKKDFDFSKSQHQYINTQLEENPAEPIFINNYDNYAIIVKLNKEKDEASLEQSRTNGAKIADWLKSKNINNVVISDTGTNQSNTFAFCEGFVLATYSFDKYFSDKKKSEKGIKEIKIESKIDIDELRALCQSVFETRNLVNEPYNKLDAAGLVQYCEMMGDYKHLSVEVLPKKKIQSLKMGGLLAVNQGSKTDPAFIILEYKPKGHVNRKPIVLVGKGVMYDTGGTSIKTSAGMTTMKCDMAGAAAVIGTIQALSMAEIEIHVIGLIPVTDNAVDNHSQVPGDIITMMNGKTVEVLNTDAEGRLILADALYYAKRYEPELVIDLATLTGAAVRSIGDVGIAAMQSGAEEFIEALQNSGSKSYERLVWFPMWKEYGEMIKSDVADLKNLGGPEAGQITAAKFLEHFIDYPWIHLDIAGPAFLEKPSSYRGKGATGVGVRLLYDFIKNYKN